MPLNKMTYSNNKTSKKALKNSNNVAGQILGSIGKIPDIILTYYFVWGMVLAVGLKVFDVERPYYELIAIGAIFIVLFYARHKTLHIREFTIRYWYLTAPVIICALYQTIRIGRSYRTFFRGIALYILIYSGFLYGKKYIKTIYKAFKATAILLAAASVIGIVWWVQGIYPLEIISYETAKYFYSAPNRMVSVFVHPILAGCFMLLLITIVLFAWEDGGILKIKSNKLWVSHLNRVISHVVRFLLLFIGIAGLYATFTRSAYLVMVFMVVIWAIGQRNKKRNEQIFPINNKNVRGKGQPISASKSSIPHRLTIPAKIIIAISAVALLAVALYVTGIAGSIYARFFGVNWREDPSYTFRIDTLRITLDSIFGRGLGPFFFGMGAGKANNILQDVEWFTEKYEVIHAIDNSYSTMFLEQGIFIAALFLSEMIYVLKKCLIPGNNKKINDIKAQISTYKATNDISTNNISSKDKKDITSTTKNVISSLYYILLPQLIMAITFDAQTWTMTEFIIFVMIGMEMANKSYPHPGFSKKHPLIINGRIFAQNVTGVQRYGIEIIKQIDKMVEPGEVILALPQGELQTQPQFTNIETAVIGKGNGNKWTQIYLPIFAYKKRGTILSLAAIAPAIKPDYVATHDISFMRYPESYGKKFRFMYRMGYLVTLYRCKGIITISEFSRDELMGFYNLDESRFTIAGNSAEQLLETCNTAQNTPAINTLAKWNLSPDEPYFLSVGSKNLHKNQKFITKLAKKYPDKKFVIAGGSSSRSFGTSGELEAETNLIMTGYISDDELLTLYANAYAFIFPSLYEGFGIPPMEAIISGVKHIALADIPVLREIYTKGCYFFDPKDVETFDISALEEAFKKNEDNAPTSNNTGKKKLNTKSKRGKKSRHRQTINHDKERKPFITDEIRTYYLTKYSWKNSARSIIQAIK